MFSTFVGLGRFINCQRPDDTYPIVSGCCSSTAQETILCKVSVKKMLTRSFPLPHRLPECEVPQADVRSPQKELPS